MRNLNLTMRKLRWRGILQGRDILASTEKCQGLERKGMTVLG